MDNPASDESPKNEFDLPLSYVPKNILAELAASRARLKTAVEVAKIGFYHWDIVKNRVTFSDQMKIDWGITADAPLEEVMKTIHPEDREATADLIESAIRNHIPFRTEYRLNRPDGKLIWIEANGKVIYSKGGEPLEFTGTSVDITDRILTRIELEKNQAELRDSIQELKNERDLRERFVNALSHDLRAPLTSVKLSAQLMLRKYTDPTLVKELRRIINSIDRGDEMVQDLLDANRLKAGEGLPLHIEVARLDQVVFDSSNLMQGLQDRPVQFENKGGEIVGYWDSRAIQRVLENLVGNAIKYGEPGTPVKIQLAKEDDHVELAVHNEGNPIPADEQALLFNAYQRSESAKESGIQGWGIGLTLVKGIAEAHQGRVSVTSDANHGTTFSVRLPIDCRKNA